MTPEPQAVAEAKAKQAHDATAAGTADVGISSPFNVEHITHVQVTVIHPLQHTQAVGPDEASAGLKNSFALVVSDEDIL